LFLFFIKQTKYNKTMEEKYIVGYMGVPLPKLVDGKLGQG
jgi:hypothetical protein